MFQLILLFAPIALLDSASIIPVCLVPLARLLDTWGKGLIIVLLVLLGLVLTVDGVWFFAAGRSLIPPPGE